MALLYVLWLVAILSIVAFEVRYASHLRMQVTANIGNDAKAYYCARAGVETVVADLLEEKKDQEAGIAPRDDDYESRYRDVKIGDGAFTLYAGLDDDGQHSYGPIDSCSHLNLNTVSADVLAKLPGVGQSVAADIVAIRKDDGFADLNELLAVKDVTQFTLYGEDQNHNGLLDANENDGDASWPPDNQDGVLDAGLSAYVTLWSASREVTSTGVARAKINEASADDIVKNVKEIDKQHADSIVFYRDKKKFASIAELLDVELVVPVPEQGNQPPPTTGDGKSGPSPTTGDGKSEPTPGDGSKDKQPKMQSTGQKAFDEAAFRKIADSVTVANQEFSTGLVNINTASAEVLACLPGLDESTAERIVDARASGNVRQGRNDYFKTVADLLDVSGVSVDVLKQVCGSITTRSDVFEARSFGTIEGQSLYRCVDAVLDRTDTRVQVRSWKVLE